MVELNKEETIAVLGIHWDSTEDTFQYLTLVLCFEKITYPMLQCKIYTAHQKPKKTF